MAVTAAQIQALVILRVGDAPDGVLASNIAAIWGSYADKASVYPRLQELYTQRACVEIVTARIRAQVDFSTGGDISIRASQQFTALLAMRKELDAQLTELETRARGNRVGVIGQITAVAPESPPTGPEPFGPVDANSERFGGSPYYRPYRPQGG